MPTYVTVSAYVIDIGKYGGSAISRRLPTFINAVRALSLIALDSVRSLAVVFREDIRLALPVLPSRPI
jgi:hypothetical protein